MKSRIDQLLQRYGFLNMLEKLKEKVPEIIQHIVVAYGLFYGEYKAPPIDLIKDFLRAMVEESPEYLSLRMDTKPEIAKKCAKRFVEILYKIGEDKLTEHKKLMYI